MAKYKQIMKDYKQPKEGENIEEFIKNNFGNNQLDFYIKIKKINYTAPLQTYYEMKELKKYYQKLANTIVPFITNDETIDSSIITKSPGYNALLTDTYNAINNKKIDELSDVVKNINELVKKRYEEEKRVLQQEHYADKEAAASYARNKTIKEMEEQKQYKDEFIDDDRDKHIIKAIPNDDRDKQIVKALPDDESSEEYYTEEDKAMKAAHNIHNKLQEDTLITRAAIDNTFYNQLPDEIKQSLRPKIEEKKAIIERSKVIRYLLPKERPKWTNATMSKGVNPLLSRGAWGI